MSHINIKDNENSDKEEITKALEYIKTRKNERNPNVLPKNLKEITKNLTKWIEKL